MNNKPKPQKQQQKIYCYVDETGQDTMGELFIVSPADTEDTLRFADLTGVRPMIETYPLERVGDAYARMMSGDAQFRVVLTM